MKTKKPNHYKQIIETLKELKADYPSTQLGKHLSTIMDELGDFWGVTDQQLSVALVKYKTQMELTDVPRGTEDEEINTIIADGMSLTAYEEQESE